MSGKSKKLSLDPAFHAYQASEASSLGLCVVNEINTYLVALYELTRVKGLDQGELGERLQAIHGLAKMAVRFGEEGESLLEGEHEGYRQMSVDIEAAQKGGAK